MPRVFISGSVFFANFRTLTTIARYTPDVSLLYKPCKVLPTYVSIHLYTNYIQTHTCIHVAYIYIYIIHARSPPTVGSGPV